MTDWTPAIAERVRAARGFIFDMDGTIALGDASSGGHRALPHATELLRSIKQHGIPLRVYTNGTAKPPATYAASLRNAGFDLEDDEMMTPSSSAAIWFARKGIKRVRVLGNDGVAAPLVDMGITIVGASKPDAVDAVYTGWFREFTFPDLEAACHSVWDGAILTTASHVPFFATATGRGIGSSFAINKMITSLTGKQAKVLGKPSRIAFDAALASMGLPKSAAPDVVVFGDDPALEMAMANGAGALGIGMTTGLMQRDTVSGLKPAQRPHALLDTLQPVRALFG